VLIEQLTGVEMAETHDDYRHAMEALVQAKVTSGEVEAPSEPPPARDLLAALGESIRAARGQ